MAASKVYRLIWRAMPALAAGLLGGLLGCASRGSDARPTGRADNPPPSAGAPSLTELQQQLDAEFQRLGIDPSKVTAAAPQGARNAVFDLSAQAVDADGQPWTPGDEGADPPAGIELGWTERLLGDYDQNGEVNAADLAPIAARFQQTVSYDDPTLHGGFDEWPSGDPEGSGAANWRDARVDGDGNGEINAADIATIAAHWKQTLTGYRVYRRPVGSADWQLLSGPAEQGFTVPRAEQSGSGLMRYSWQDIPPTAGEYEYCVAAYFAGGSGYGAGESPKSNIAVSVLTVDLTDTLPPIWDESVGITTATPNPDSSVTVAFGSATDVAPPGVASSAPVRYTVYWSRESPLDFAVAAYQGDVQSGWVSPVLLPGTTYYFAVRAEDSQQPPNRETNAVELEAITAGEPQVDTQPPVWIEPDPDPQDLSPIEGFRHIEPLDGALRITRAEAADALSPPVRYDLYYISDHIADSVFTDTNGQILHPEVQILEDIPPVLEMPWRNRESVSLLIRARDSAGNTEKNRVVVKRSPGRGQRIVIDPNIPGLDVPDFDRIQSRTTSDYQKQKAYCVYTVRSYQEALSEKQVWSLELDLRTGVWQSKLLYEVKDPARRALDPKIAVSWTGDVWASWHISGAGGIHFMVKRAGGDWEVWDATDPPISWIAFSQNFDHNGNPLDLQIAPSSIQPDRFKLLYRYWDAPSQSWMVEEAFDPGTNESYVFRRPDGVMQLLVIIETGGGPSDNSPRTARILERSTAGEWSAAYEFPKPDRSAGISLAMNASLATWDSPVAWSCWVFQDGIWKLMTYGVQQGYLISELPAYNGELLRGQFWPAGDGNYHALSTYIWQGDHYFKQNLGTLNYSQAILRPKQIGALPNMGNLDPVSGEFAIVNKQPNFATGQYEWILYRPHHGDTLFGEQ